VESFQTLFGRRPAVAASAPGRVNLIGEHTDYNDGFVLPTVVPRRADVELAPRGDDVVRAASANVPGAGAVHTYRLGGERPGYSWLDYLQGITRELARSGVGLGGFDLRIASSVPIGCGLSSSAALEVAVLRALREAFRLPLDDVELALVGQRAESRFVGARVGVMDQMAASVGEQGSALFLDTRSLVFERVPLPDADVVVIDSGIAHAHAAGGYNTRRSECEQAAVLLGVASLRELELRDLPRIAQLPEPLGRRVRHVVSENARVLAAVDAMRAGDLAKLGALFYVSHRSMQLDYEVSVPEVDLLVERAREDADVYGARLTGGGFGGAVVVLARAGQGGAVAARLTRAGSGGSAPRPAVLVP
jgi:galactokinase